MSSDNRTSKTFIFGLVSFLSVVIVLTIVLVMVYSLAGTLLIQNNGAVYGIPTQQTSNHPNEGSEYDVTTIVERGSIDRVTSTPPKGTSRDVPNGVSPQ